MQPHPESMFLAKKWTTKSLEQFEAFWCEIYEAPFPKWKIYIEKEDII